MAAAMDGGDQVDQGDASADGFGREVGVDRDVDRDVNQDLDRDLDERLMKLEIKLTEAEDWIDALNTIVARQQDQIELLMRELSDLRRRQDQQPGAFRSLMDEIPPHY